MKTPHTLCACSGFAFLCVTASVASAQRISRISVDSGSHQGDAESYCSSISAHGRYVAFGSYATNLVPGDTNDEYLVACLRQNWAGRKIGSEAADWLKDSRRTW